MEKEKGLKQFAFNGAVLLCKPTEKNAWSCPNCYFWDYEDCIKTGTDAGLPDCLEKGCYFKEKTDANTETKQAFIPAKLGGNKQGYTLCTGAQ